MPSYVLMWIFSPAIVSALFLYICYLSFIHFSPQFPLSLSVLLFPSIGVSLSLCVCLIFPSIDLLSSNEILFQIFLSLYALIHLCNPLSLASSSSLIVLCVPCCEKGMNFRQPHQFIYLSLPLSHTHTYIY